ncbi:MAG: hypothetical protein ACI4WG_04290 [Erysipelotrichaceae bacterium]
MKKVLTLIIVFLLLASFGCNKKITTERIAIISDDHTTKVLLLDNDNKVLAEKEIEGGYRFRLQNKDLFYSPDGVEYFSFNIDDLSEGLKLDDVFGYLLYVIDSDRYVTYQDGKAVYVDKSEQKYLEGYLSIYCGDDNYFYMVDYSNYLYIYQLSDFSLVTKQRVANSNYLNFAKIDEQVYLVNDYGYSLIEPTGCSSTFFYPNDFNQIDNNYGNLLFVVENKEEMVYRVSFSKNQMVLEEEYNEIYYESLDFAEIFEAYYQQGYQVITYLEVY